MRGPIVVFWGLLVTLPVVAEDRLPYPPTRVDSVLERLHGVLVADPYRWLEDGQSQEVRAWITRQNALTRSVLDAYPKRELLRQRLETLLDIGGLGTPISAGDNLFFTRRSGKQNQPVLYLRRRSSSADRALVDPNSLAADGSVTLDWWYPSPNGRFLAYGVSRGGNEQSVLHVCDTSSGKDLPDVIEHTRACSLAWLPDSSGFFYTRYPSQARPGEEHYHRHLFLHHLGEDARRDRAIFGEGRAAEEWLEVQLSPGGRWLVVTVGQGWARSEIYFSDRQSRDNSFSPLATGVDAHFTALVRDETIYLLTNLQAPRKRLLAVDPQRPDRSAWREVLPQSAEVLEAVTRVGTTLVTLTKSRAQAQIALHDSTGKLLRKIGFPVPGTVTGLSGAWNGSEVFFGFHSLTVPPTVYCLELSTRDMALWDRVQADFKAQDYVLEDVVIPSADWGRTPIPMILAHRKDVKPGQGAPTLLVGYGGFNLSMTPAFSASRLPFLERGGVLALPHLRGGGEYGAAWHRAGMLESKQNTIDDMIGAADWLVGQGWTTRSRLALQGSSNGGLLVAAVLTQRPDLCRAVVCQVPVLDMLRYPRFLIGRLWIPEYGCPDDPEAFRWLYAYSPYHRVRYRTPYPAVLLTTAEADTRVDPLHARKMAARLQAATTSSRPVLLRTDIHTGHGAGRSRAMVHNEACDVWSFLFQHLEVE